MTESKTMFVDGREIPIRGERNVLELCRNAGIDIPSFCYHSELSVFGACRLCLVDIEGRGIVTSCTTKPEPGMRIRTTTEEIRKMRRIGVELLLASHDHDCPTCAKSATCKLQDLARRLGVTEVRYPRNRPRLPVDDSSPAIVIDPNRCVLCGDCVRACREIQSVGALDFVDRGASCRVAPAFNKKLSEVECVGCGLCATVCPTGAITPHSEVESVWSDLDDPDVTVVAQIAPAVRVALGEDFGLEPGTVTTGLIAAALRRIGFHAVYDTSFAADMTVIEEATEFLERRGKGGSLPMFTSCCPAWVKFAEQFFPDLLPHLSTCRSPQQMFGSVAKRILPERLGVTPENLRVVSIMPCTAKKFEAKRPEFAGPAGADVDHVITTQELTRMIKEHGVVFNRLEAESLDMPLGYKTGAGVIFGASGGVSEAVLRYAAQALGGVRGGDLEFREVRGEKSVREASVTVGGETLRIAVVHGLANTRALCEKVLAGETDYDMIEVMACPGGCVGGAGQPLPTGIETRSERARGLYEADRTLQMHAAQDNHMVAECYERHLDGPGSPEAHALLHTGYHSRRRIADEAISLVGGDDEAERLAVRVCVGTNCYLRGSQDILIRVMNWVEEQQLQDSVEVGATFCFENCGHSPNARVGDRMIESCDANTVIAAICEKLGLPVAGRIGAAPVGAGQ